MGSYLIVFNGTTGGDQLVIEVRRRTAREPSSFFVLVPVPASESEQPGFVETITTGEARVMVREVDLPSRLDREREELERQSRHHLEHLMREIRAAGGEADGDLGHSDPLEAIGREVRVRQFDEIIISTPPSGLSKWLHRDLTHRVERRFGLPVKDVTPKP